MTEHPWSYHGCCLDLSSRPRETTQLFRLKDRLMLLAMGQWWFRPARPAVGEQASQTSFLPEGDWLGTERGATSSPRRTRCRTYSLSGRS